MHDDSQLLDALQFALIRARHMRDDVRGLVGYGAVCLLDPDGGVLDAVPFTNLITDAGDLYYAKKGIVGISPASATAPTAVNGIKLGTGTAAETKNGAGAALGTYLSASNRAFDNGYPTTNTLSAGSGVQAVYQATIPAGTATNSAITEAVIVTDATTDATSTAANTISRGRFSSSVNKASDQALLVLWNHLNKGT
jgi:hypothetical protein